MKFSETLKRQPNETRKALLANNDLLNEIKEILKPKSRQIKNISPWLTDLFANFLPNLQPTTTILCLGSGSGIELLHLRNLIPEGVLFATDNKINVASVITEILTEATFIPVDFTNTNPKELFEKISIENQKAPEVVICRHPHVLENPWWAEFLAQWAVLIKQGYLDQLLITNFSNDERWPILKAINAMGIIPQISSYNGGEILELPNRSNNKLRSDNYITSFPSLPQTKS